MRRRTSQQSLDFNGRGRPAGRGRGPGRPIGPNPQMRHRSREIFRRTLPCHVTLKVQTDVPSLRCVKVMRELERTFSQGCERGDFRLLHYTIMGDHVHFLVEARSEEALGRGMKSLGSRLARAVNRVFQRKGRVLRDRYHLHVLRTPKEVRNALAYVLLNARRHAKRVGKVLRIDPASSGRWFDGWRQRVPRSAEPPAVARPRSWLVTKGWRRHGLIDALGVPG